MATKAPSSKKAVTKPAAKASKASAETARMRAALAKAAGKQAELASVLADNSIAAEDKLKKVVAISGSMGNTLRSYRAA